jgi:hypothetical protein
MMTREVDRDLQARLHFAAVLPSLEGLALFDPTSRQLAAQIKGQVRLRILGGPGVTLTLMDQGHSGSALVVDLIYLNSSHFLSSLTSKWLPPFPWRGLGRPSALTAFATLAERLQVMLNPVLGEASIDEEQRRLYAQLLFPLMTRALPPLVQVDSLAQEAWSHLPDGLVVTQLAPAGITVWVEKQGENIRSGIGPPPREARPTVTVSFTTLSSAVAALQDSLDMTSAVNRGEVLVRGHTPLADGLNVVLARLRDYLELK